MLYSGFSTLPRSVVRLADSSVRWDNTDVILYSDIDMSTSTLKPEFARIREVTMGSQYNEADLTLTGEWIPDLPKFRWQDKFGESADGRYLLLIAWEILFKYELGFRCVLIDKLERQVRISKRRPGPCEEIRWYSNGFDLIINEMTSLREAKSWPAL